MEEKKNVDPEERRRLLICGNSGLLSAGVRFLSLLMNQVRAVRVIQKISRIRGKVSKSNAENNNLGIVL